MNDRTESSGAPVHTNALAHESSPYLLQHAHNPVDWHAWGPDAFERARRANKPIFLSIGYSTCYWCHVMERQCFENESIAALMNEHFINIKVDREERPDVDDIYMAAVQVTTGRGGWPMSVFLTPPGARGPNDPGLEPFYAGTYFPPAPMHGSPSFPQVLEHLSRSWRDEREKVLNQAGRITQAVRENLVRRDVGGALSSELVQNAYNQLMHIYDQTHGGFGDAPKFPQPNHLDLLIAIFRIQPDAEIWRPVAHTLDRMARGGMYDQVGGGFHRYSVDAQWLVPHFEKMLYDNAQLLQTYCSAQALNPRDDDPGFYPRVMRQVCDYVLREMLDETGTFWSAQDAEVDAREGGNYVWTADQVREALAELNDDALTELALEMYGLDRGTNFQDPHHPEEPPSNVLYLPVPLHELALKRNITLNALLDAKARIDAQLFAVRSRRKQPATDDKVLTSWNGMMIAGLARAGRTLDDATYVQAAARAARYILDHMRDESGGLYRTMRQGQAKIPAFLEDYAFLAAGLIELSRAQPLQSHWLEAARDIMRQASDRFSAEHGGYYDTLADQPDLFVRTRSFYDGAISSANSQMVHNQVDLFELTGEEHFLDDAIGDMRSFAGTMQRYGAAMSHMVHALTRAITLDPAKVAAASAIRPQTTDDQPVAVTVTAKEGDLNEGTLTLTITLEVREGYHINANEPGIAALAPTELSLRDAPGLALTVAYPQGRKRPLAFAETPVSVYEDTVELEATLSRAADGSAPLPKRLQLVVRYQACTASECLEAQTLAIPIAID